MTRVSEVSRAERPAAAAAGGRAGRHRAASVALGAALLLGTLAGVVLTSTLAFVLAAPRILSTGLQPRPESAALRWLVDPDVAEPATRVLLWLLAGATALLAALVAVGARRSWTWRAYSAWATVGGVLTAYALVANWQLAPEAGLLAFGVGALWSAAVYVGVARVKPWE